jgi:hypothetical protein
MMKKPVARFLIFSSLFFILNSSTPALGAEASEAISAVNKFFSNLKRGKVKEACEKIFEDSSLVLEKEKDKPKTLAKKVEATLKGLEKISGHEQVGSKNISNSLYGLIYILKFDKSLPLRWYFLYYKHKGKWMLADLRYDDRIMELLTESE